MFSLESLHLRLERGEEKEKRIHLRWLSIRSVHFIVPPVLLTLQGGREAEMPFEERLQEGVNNMRDVSAVTDVYLSTKK